MVHSDTEDDSEDDMRHRRPRTGKNPRIIESDTSDDSDNDVIVLRAAPRRRSAGRKRLPSDIDGDTSDDDVVVLRRRSVGKKRRISDSDDDDDTSDDDVIVLKAARGGPDSGEAGSFSDVPRELMQHIMGLLPLTDRSRTAHTCRWMEDVERDMHLGTVVARIPSRYIQDPDDFADASARSLDSFFAFVHAHRGTPDSLVVPERLQHWVGAEDEPWDMTVPLLLRYAAQFPDTRHLDVELAPSDATSPYWIEQDAETADDEVSALAQFRRLYTLAARNVAQFDFYEVDHAWPVLQQLTVSFRQHRDDDRDEQDDRMYKLITDDFGGLAHHASLRSLTIAQCWCEDTDDLVDVILAALQCRTLTTITVEFFADFNPFRDTEAVEDLGHFTLSQRQIDRMSAAATANRATVDIEDTFETGPDVVVPANMRVRRLPFAR
jgi:hypothetical protein